ncbi:MAG TPA: class I SAM-dependent methyltransferase [Ktedonobacteraceae bacterium]|nr:class I SAM-dependent methyltransferase [Ktedonobacteraceae bacterium]
MIHPISTSPIMSVEEQELMQQLEVTRFLLEEMGGSLPREQMVTKQLTTVLDVACGVGGWVLDVARTYPHLQVTGIDIYKPCLEYAQHFVNKGGLANARFLARDMRLLDRDTNTFSAGSIDLINVAFIASTLLSTGYTSLMHTFVRLCRPGGLLRWTEMEFPITNSPAFERLTALVCRALHVAGQTFIPPSLQIYDQIFTAWRREEGRDIQPAERRHVGITPMLGSWLRRAGCHAVQSFPTAIEVSTGTVAHPYFVRQVEVFGQHIAPFLRTQGVILTDDLTALLNKVQDEIQQADFCGLCFILTVCATKPA